MKKILTAILVIMTLQSCKVFTGLRYSDWKEGNRAEKVDEWAYKYGWHKDTVDAEVYYLKKVLPEPVDFKTKIKEIIDTVRIETPTGNVELWEMNDTLYGRVYCDTIEIRDTITIQCPPVLTPSKPEPVYIPLSFWQKLFITLGKLFSGILIAVAAYFGFKIWRSSSII